jgi:hypothetical protein
MARKFVFLLILLGFVLAIPGQTIDIFKLPDVGDHGKSMVKCPAIATNSLGDIMVVFRNKEQSIMYYFIKKSTGKITQTKLLGSKDKDIVNTGCVATADDNFHAVWGNLISTDPKGVGVFYSDFDLSSETWSSPVQLEDIYPEDSHLRVNPVNDDIVMCTVLRSQGAKNIFVKFRKKGQTTWGNEINISGTPSGKSSTNPYAHFDEQGYLHVTYKEDRGEDDLNIRAALIKPETNGSYTLVDKQWATTNTGWQFLPSIAMVGTKGIITFFYKQEGAYFYLPYERVGDKLAFDQKNVTKLVDGPLQPFYYFSSKAIAHGDEILYTYFDTERSLKLIRYKNGQWLDSQPFAIGGDFVINKLPYQVWADPNIGLFTSWFIEEKDGDGLSYYSIFNYPKPSIRPPVDVTYVKAMERSLFHGFWLYDVKWANNPDNIAKQIKVINFNIYRRVKGSAEKWLKVGTVAGTVFTFGDINGITPTSNFEYAVTAVNEKGIESRIQDEGTPAAEKEKNNGSRIQNNKSAREIQ